MAEKKEKSGHWPVRELREGVAGLNQFVCSSSTQDKDGMKKLLGIIDALKKEAEGLEEIMLEITPA